MGNTENSSGKFFCLGLVSFLLQMSRDIEVRSRRKKKEIQNFHSQPKVSPIFWHAVCAYSPCPLQSSSGG